MKLDWKKTDKAFYLPGTEPELVTVPAFKFFAIRGAGDPNEPAFQDYMAVLYALAYAVRMSPKSGTAPAGYLEYSVFPLEGVWDVSEEAKARGGAGISKSEYVFDLMIRQPDFVTPEYALSVIDRTKARKPLPRLGDARFEVLEEGPCVQMTHRGPYDAEPASFARMEEFCAARGLRRLSKVHREIYMSDPRKTAPEKLRTVLRFRVK
ncbi:MAG TPA: GyrI-like domain-containing protein [Spirochaetia bacterium]|nr:GyrI-like domain-containing protein [Spirochaetales bacterium]HRY79659.1 GyrI-like domain-containing protein [Spirochaetia bacterium]HRZ89120.1 GyrI-like domain-containing protein [Spirochaetia bacterium]